MNRNFNKNRWAIFASYIKPHRRDFAIDMGLSLLVALVDLAFPFVSRRAMQRLLPEQMFRTFFIVMGILIAAYLLRAVCQYFVTVVGHRMGTLVEADMRRDVFSHMQGMSYSFFDHNRTGVLLARVTNDLFEIVELAHHGPENLLTCGATLIGSIIILLFVNWKLALVLMVMVPLAIIFGTKQLRAMERANKEVK